MSRFEEIIAKKRKDWGCPELMDIGSIPTSKIPFSSPLLNYSTYGGIPRNRITEFCGVPGGGKSTTAIDICKNAYELFKREYDEDKQKLQVLVNKGDKSAKIKLEELEDRGPKRVLYVDLEHSFDTAWSKTLNIDPDKIEIMQPPDVFAEDILQTVQELIESDELGLVVIDSLPSLVTQSEIDKKYGERTVASLSGLLTVFFRKITPILTRYETTLLFINQIRQNFENPYVIKTPGGEAPKYYASLRMLFQLGKPVDFLGNELPMSTENPDGYIINAKILKQKSAPNDRKQGSYFLMCKSGIRVDMDYAQLAMKRYGLIRKAGAWFSFVEPDTGEILEVNEKTVKVNGMIKVYEFLQNNTEYFNRLKKYIEDDINGKQSGEIGFESANEIL